MGASGNSIGGDMLRLSMGSRRIAGWARPENVIHVIIICGLKIRYVDNRLRRTVAGR